MASLFILDFFPEMLNKAGAWLEQSGRKSMILEIPNEWTKNHNYLLVNGWKKQYSWLELVRCLDERARQDISRS